MKKVRLLLVLMIIAMFAVVGTAVAQPENFRAHLAGREEVPPVATRATGQAIFQLNSSGTALNFKLIVANIDDVVAAHIHCAPAGVNGGVGVTLFSSSPSGRVNGILAEGTITTPEGCGWTDLDDVVAAMQSGDTYVNVHTIPPGVPSGEIRGQIH